MEDVVLLGVFGSGCLVKNRRTRKASILIWESRKSWIQARKKQLLYIYIYIHILYIFGGNPTLEQLLSGWLSQPRTFGSRNFRLALSAESIALPRCPKWLTGLVRKCSEEQHLFVPERGPWSRTLQADQDWPLYVSACGWWSQNLFEALWLMSSFAHLLPLL